MLESYDPKWERKADRIFARLKVLEEKYELTADDVAERHNLVGASHLACDAALRTPAELVRRDLHFILHRAERERIWVWVPRVSPDADLDTTRAAIDKVRRYVEAVSRERSLRFHCRRAGVVPDYGMRVRARSMLTVPIVLAMLRYRIARRWLRRSIPKPF